jgi:hypothetical protein
METTQKQKLIGALVMLKQALKCRDIEDAHNILIDGDSWGTDVETMEEDVENYIGELDDMIDMLFSQK